MRHGDMHTIGLLSEPIYTFRGTPLSAWRAPRDWESRQQAFCAIDPAHSKSRLCLRKEAWPNIKALRLRKAAASDRSLLSH